MKVFKAAMVMMVLTFSSVLWAQGVAKSSLNFAADQAAKLHCTIQQQASSGLWDLTVKADDADGHVIFNYLYSVHPNVKKSMNDCHAWISAVNKKKAAMATPAKQYGGQGGQK